MLLNAFLFFIFLIIADNAIPRYLFQNNDNYIISLDQLKDFLQMIYIIHKYEMIKLNFAVASYC